MRTLVLGCGSVGSRHLHNLATLEAGELAAFDPEPEALARAGRDAPGLATFTDLGDAWGWKPDLVLVTSPTSLHAEQALDALRHGCDVFVEKPLSDSADGLDGLVSEAASRGAVTMVACNLRFHPGVAEMKRIVDSGVLGQVVTARVEFGQWLPDWRPGTDHRASYSANRGQGGGIVLDAIHEIDYAMWLFGLPEQAVGVAARLSMLTVDTEDTADLILRFEGGPVATVHMDYVQRAYTRSCKVAGTEGTAVWDWPTGRVSVYTASAGEWSVVREDTDYDKNDMYVEGLRCFLECVRERKTTPNPLDAARRTLEVALSVRGG